MSAKRPPNQVRIIAGQWRGRRLPILDLPGLRPTGDRVRETAFNWLGPKVVGARCLDLFAGSGALGLEALSRGARSVVFVEQSKEALGQLVQSTETWPGIEKADFVRRDAIQWLQGPSEEFDLIFVDPPFDVGLQADALKSIVEKGWIKASGWVYLERPKDQMALDQWLDPHWQIDRQKTLGQVEISVLRYHKG